MFDRKSFTKEKLHDTYNWPMYYRELGFYVHQREEYERSLQFFDKSLQKEPNNLRALQNRAIARAKSKKIVGALEDIAKILTLKPDDIYSKAEKALITYLSCEFEDSLVQNYRNVPLRKKPDNFVMGVMHCEDAIMNCIAERAGKPLRDHFKFIRQIAWRKTMEKQRPFKPVAKNRVKKKRSFRLILPTSQMKEEIDRKQKKREQKELKQQESKNAKSTEKVRHHSRESTTKLLTSSMSQLAEESSIRDTLNSDISSLENLKIPPGPKFPYRPIQRHTTNIENYLAERYLDKLFHDKLLLKNLPHIPGASNANKKGSAKIEQLAAQGFKNLYRTQEILRARRPFYFIKYQEMRSCGKLHERRLATLLLLQKMAKKQADNTMEKIENAVKDRKIRKLLEAVEKLVVFCEVTSKNVFPSREEYLTKMEDLLCEGFYEMKKFSPKMTDHQKNERVKLLLGLPLRKFPSKDSIAKDLREMFVDWRKMLKTYEKRLFKATRPGEFAWLYHELARFSIELKQYEMARLYARKCITEANLAKKLKWILNAMLMIAKIDVTTNNKNDAKNQVRYAKNVAARLKDDEMVELLNMCVAAIEKSAADEATGLKLLKMRKKRILNLLTTREMKDEASFMFKRIQTLPASKRMSIMPGFSFMDEKVSNKEETQSFYSDISGKGKKFEPPLEKRGIRFVDYLQ